MVVLCRSCTQGLVPRVISQHDFITVGSCAVTKHRPQFRRNIERSHACCTLDCPMTIDVTRHHADRFANLRLSQGECRSRPAVNRRTISQPLVADRTHAVGIRQRIGCGERLSLRSHAADRHAASWRVICVDHGSRRGTGHRFQRALAIDITRNHRDRRTDLGLTQNQGARRRARNRHAGRQPLVVDSAHAIDICQGIGCSQRLALSGRTTDGHAASWRVIDVDHGSRRGAGHRFQRALPIDIARDHGDSFADLRLRQSECRSRSTANNRSVGHPLVTDSAQTISVRQGIAGGEGLALLWHSCWDIHFETVHPTLKTVIRVSDPHSTQLAQQKIIEIMAS